MNITRTIGGVFNGHAYGAGLYGSTDALDIAVQDLAKWLSDHFQADVTIRFNSDRNSGGAWLIDTRSRDVSIGIGAKLHTRETADLLHELAASEFLSPEMRAHTKELADKAEQMVGSITYDALVDDRFAETVDLPLTGGLSWHDFGTAEETKEYVTKYFVGLRRNNTHEN